MTRKIPLSELDLAEVYLPLDQVGSGSITFVLEAGPNVESLTQSAMEAVWAANPSQAVWGEVTLEGAPRRMARGTTLQPLLAQRVFRARAGALGDRALRPRQLLGRAAKG
ncbi:MAG: hypothetical protein O2958_13660 [Gemmatimonadetes bacterium]|nr:hypothetical protein [Gemmatimonadota bacterium]